MSCIVTCMWVELGRAGYRLLSQLTHSGGEVAQKGDQWLSLSAGLLAQLAEH